DIEVSHHLLYDRELLRVLLAEIGPVGLQDAEQLYHHRGHAPEVAGPPRSLERRGDGAEVDDGLEAGRIHLLDRRREQKVAPGCLEQARVALDVLRVAGQVFGRAEL